MNLFVVSFCLIYNIYHFILKYTAYASLFQYPLVRILIHLPSILLSRCHIDPPCGYGKEGIREKKPASVPVACPPVRIRYLLLLKIRHGTLKFHDGFYPQKRSRYSPGITNRVPPTAIISNFFNRNASFSRIPQIEAIITIREGKATFIWEDPTF